VARGGYDYVLMGNLQSATQWLASLMPVGGTTRLLWSESNLDSINRKSGPAKWFKRLLYSRCDALVCPGQRAVDCGRYFNPQAAAKPVLWLPNLVDNSVFVDRLNAAKTQREKIRHELGISPQQCLFLAIGRHVDYKGFGHLIEAFSKAHGPY